MKAAAGRAGAVAAALAGLLALFALAVWLALPAWLETRLVPDLARRYGLEDVALDIRHIGPGGLDAADIRIGHAVTVAHLTADYQPGALLRRRIERIAVSGLTVHAAWDGRRLRIKGIDLPGFGGPESASGAGLPDAWIGRLEIRAGLLALDWGRTRIKLPFSLVAACPAADLSRVNARLEIFPHCNPIRVMLQTDAHEFEIEADAALRLPSPWNGLLDISRLNASGRLDGESGLSGKLAMEVDGNIGGPLPLELDVLRIQASGDIGNIEAKGEFAAATGGNLAVGALQLASTGIQGTFSARLADLARWQATFTAAATAPTLELTTGGQTVHFGRPEIHLDLSGEKSALDMAARFTSGPGRLAPEGFGITWPKIEAEAHGTTDWSDPLAKADLRVGIHLPQVKASSGQIEAQLRGIRLAGRLLPGQPPGVNADLRAAGRIVWPALDLAAENIALHLPLQWPVAKPAAGSLALKLIPRPELNPGSLEAVLRQTERGLVIDGVLQDLFFTGTDLQLAAAADLTPSGIQGRLETDLAAWSPVAPIDLGILAPAAAGLTVDGKLTLHADLALEAGRLQSQARIELSEGALAATARQIRADGVQVDLHLIDLPTLRSAPGQVLRFAEADLGSIRLSDGTVAFQVEAAHQALLEKGSFAWCQGRVYVDAMRFSPAVDDHHLTLFCDRLRLSELLDQVGGLAAEGGGTVSGRIPVQYRRGQLAFNDGFLYSSPGEGGKIRLADIDRFTTAIDPQTLEAAQLALASEALKDYDYQWVKVGIDSQNDLLALRLQFDGKPAHPLPFVYRQESGRFVRVAAPDPGSRFQGIGLDINLRLPLNRILEYGDLMKRLE